MRNKLEASESSGRTDAEITLDDGRKYVGKLQFGEARLKDYQKATGTKFTQAQFKGNSALQDRVAAWHLDDLDQAIDDLGEDAKAYDRDGLRAVAHLSGKIGMKKFVQRHRNAKKGWEVKSFHVDWNSISLIHGDKEAFRTLIQPI